MGLPRLNCEVILLKLVTHPKVTLINVAGCVSLLNLDHPIFHFPPDTLKLRYNELYFEAILISFFFFFFPIEFCAASEKLT